MIGERLEADVLGARAVGMRAILVRSTHPDASVHCPTLTQVRCRGRPVGEMIWRWLPLAGVVVFLGVVGWRLWWQRRRYGTRRVPLFQSPRWQDNLRDALGVVLVVPLSAQAIMAARGLTSEGSGHLFDHPVDDVRHVGGTALLFGGLALLVVALLDLGVSWRIGIEEGSRSGLVTSGLYRVCRNPIFAAILLMLA